MPITVPSRGARHVDDDSRRVARNVLADEAGEQPRIQIVIAANGGAHDHAYLLALVEVADGIGPGGTGAEEHEGGCRGRSKTLMHLFDSCLVEPCTASS
jgi:hypothetical protein